MPYNLEYELVFENNGEFNDCSVFNLLELLK